MLKASLCAICSSSTVLSPPRDGLWDTDVPPWETASAGRVLLRLWIPMESTAVQTPLISKQEAYSWVPFIPPMKILEQFQVPPGLLHQLQDSMRLSVQSIPQQDDTEPPSSDRSYPECIKSQISYHNISRNDFPNSALISLPSPAFPVAVLTVEQDKGF